MVLFRPGSHVYFLVTLLSVVGEFPFQSLHLLGSERVYKALIVRLTQPDRIVDPQTGAEAMCRLFTLTGSGRTKSVRLYKKALFILEWIHPGAYQYYMDSFYNHLFPGDASHRDRNHRVAEAAGMCMRAGADARAYLLPQFQSNERLMIAARTPSFYFSRDLKRLSLPELSKIQFTRMVGAVFYPGGCYAVYNTRSVPMKWNGMGEFKTVGSLTELARMNAGIIHVDSAILFGTSEEIALQSFSEKSKEQKKEIRADAVFRHIHFIPLNEYGIRQLRLLTVPDWKNRLLELLFEADALSHDTGHFEYDAFVDGAYVFSYLDGDLTRLVRFREGIEDKPGPFEVLCFPHQVDFLREYLAGRAVIKTIGLEAIESALNIPSERSGAIE